MVNFWYEIRENNIQSFRQPKKFPLIQDNFSALWPAGDGSLRSVTQVKTNRNCDNKGRCNQIVPECRFFFGL
jgi:hypothetical protein